jgi:transcriptional regulator with GAF, ATPase, and Fis domain/tetratricopeptide (TPR) repeat protein
MPPQLPDGYEPVRRMNPSDAPDEVWEARTAEGRRVVRVGPGAWAEIGLADRVQAPGLPLPGAWGQDDSGRPWVARPWIDGTPFAEAAASGDEDALVDQVRSLLITLDALHGAGFVHRDVKSENVLVGPAGVHLVDLQLASSSGTASAAGSPFTLAPEVLLGQPATPSSDLFSVGAMVALALCGTPDASFHERFPGADFWEASGLDSERLPTSVRHLVTTLVRRLPSARPDGAANALAMLPHAIGPAPSLRLPFLRGREQDLEQLARALADSTPVSLVSCPPGEAASVTDHLKVNLALIGVSVRTVSPSSLDRDVGGLVLLDPDDDAADLLVERLLGSDDSDPDLVAVRPADDATDLEALLKSRALPEEFERCRRFVWPPVPVAVVEEHLRTLLGDGAPAAARALARSLHQSRRGAWPAIDRALRRSVEDGVLREGDAHTFLALREDWPLPDEAAAPSGGEDGRRLLAALDAWDSPCPTGVLAQLADLPDDRSTLALAGLLRDGFAREGREGLTTTGSAARAAHAGLTDRERAALHARCLQERGDDHDRSLRHRWHQECTDELREDVLDALQRARCQGRPTEARRLLRMLRDECVQAWQSEPWCGRLLAIEARLEVSQGDGARALQGLHDHYGAELADAGPEVLLAAWRAEEGLGRRDEALALLDRLDGAVPEGMGNQRAELAAWVHLGRALNATRDGDPASALALLGEKPGADTPDEPAVSMLHLRGACLTAEGDLAGARGAYEQAIERARAADDRLSLARGEMNRAHLDRRAGDLPSAQAGLERALALFDQADHPEGRANTLNNLAVLHRDLGDLTGARRLSTRALALQRRVGDRRNAMNSLGSLALLALDAGEAGAALRLVERAERLATEGRWGAEGDVLRWQRVAALALASRRDGAERLATASAAGGQGDEVLAGWARAVHALLSGRPDAARSSLDSAEQAAQRAARPGDRYRLAALRVLLDGDDAARTALQAATESVDGPLRRAETAWRLAADPDELDPETLRGWLDLFREAGRTDLVSSVGRRLASRLSLATARRAAAARADEAAEALVDGLEPNERRHALANASRLAGGATTTGHEPGLAWVSVFQRRLAREEDLDGLLAAVVDMALELTGARRGLVVVEAGDRAEVAVARGSDHASLALEQAQFSRTVVDRALTSGRPLVTTDAGGDDRFRGTASIDELHLRSILCHPFDLPDGGKGALLLDDELQEAVFDGADVATIGLLADQAALAISWMRKQAEVRSLSQRLAARVATQEEELERARALLRRRGTVAPVAGLVGQSEAMLEVFSLVDRLAPTELPVLVTGASGTGKDLVSRALHERSRRADGPLVIENVAALPAQLLESELFGHVRGAFTGADRDRPGLFAEADGGTFVLDEMGEMPAELQPKLLRVLESGEFRPVGSRRTQRADVRIVAATNRDLLERVREGAFREDLFYRLNAAEIRLPDLEERLGDVPLLLAHFLDRLNEQHGTTKTVTDAVVAAVVARPWPGQVRELANEMARLYHLSGDVLDDPSIVRVPRGVESDAAPPPASLALADAEHAAIARALQAAGGRKAQAARLLGISRAGLYEKLKKRPIEDGED